MLTLQEIGFHYQTSERPLHSGHKWKLLGTYLLVRRGGGFLMEAYDTPFWLREGDQLVGVLNVAYDGHSVEEY